MYNKQQATSNKQQATSNKQQATSNKQQATSLPIFNFSNQQHQPNFYLRLGNGKEKFGLFFVAYIINQSLIIKDGFMQNKTSVTPNGNSTTHGLLGYYFSDDSHKKLAYISESDNGELAVDLPETVKSVVTLAQNPVPFRN